MKKIKCFEVLGHTDTTEGRAPMKVVARFSNFHEAERYVTSKSYSQWCVMGYLSSNDIKNIRESEIVILDSLDELELFDRENLRKQALAKLTKQERESLGL